MKKLPVLITIPHCSELFPDNVREQILLDDSALREEIDPLSDKFFEVDNAFVLKAPYSRLLVDMNRPPDDFSPKTGLVVEFSHTGEPFYAQALERTEVLQRVEQYHQSYHDQLRALLPKVRFLLDGHSCRPFDMVTHKGRADILLGSRDGATCSPEMMKEIVAFFQNQDFSVSVNDPFRGRYIIDNYCTSDGLMGIQMEVNQALYLDQESSQSIQGGVSRLKSLMTDFVGFLEQKI